MQGIVIGIDPVLLRLGAFELRWYGLMVGLAIVAAAWLFSRQATRRGFTSDDVPSLVLWAVLGGVIGSRLFHIVDRLDFYLSHPEAMISLQQGGLAIWGGVAGGALAVILYGWRRRFSLSLIADMVAPAVLVGQIIGRLGCIINGDAFGGPTSLPWGFIYTHANALLPDSLRGVPTHPYPVYEMIWNLGVLGILLLVRNRLPAQGLVFATYVGLYSVGRFLLTYVRQEELVLWGLQQAQLVALMGLIIAALYAAYLLRRAPAPIRAAR